MTIRAIIAPFPFCYVIPVLLLKDLSCCGYILPDAKEAFIRMVDCQTARIYFAHQGHFAAEQIGHYCRIIKIYYLLKWQAV
jgi:hypothetical protein